MNTAQMAIMLVVIGFVATLVYMAYMFACKRYEI